MEIIESILTNNPCYKAGKKIQVKGLMLHSVGCPQPSAEVFVKQWNSPAASRACIHAFIDGNTGKVYQTLPWEHRAWHCGGNANNTHIGVEMCEPSCIRYTGGASFTCSNREAAMELVKRTYEAAVELFAFLCGKYNLNPLENGVIISHKEGHDRGLASGHGDPDHLWKGLQCDYTMDGFRRDVNAAMCGAAQTTAQSQSGGERTVAQPQSSAAQNADQSQSNGGQTLQPGRVVKLAADAIYYTGKEMPEWVKSDQWIVKSISGDRAVLGKNAAGTHEINSPVNVRFLHLTASGVQMISAPQAAQSVSADKAAPSAQAVSADKAAPSAQAVSADKAVSTYSAAPSGVSGEMSVSDRGVELVAKFEGCRLEAYKCPAGVWTIGYGHTAGVSQGDKLASQEEAKALLKKDLKKYGSYVNDCVKKKMINFSLTQNQFDALTSFCYNCGNGSLQKLVAGRDSAAIAEKMLQYNKGGGKVLAGLVRRREEERALFLS